MATSNPTKRRIGIALLALALAVSAILVVGVTESRANASVDVGDLTIQDPNATVDGDVTDIVLDAQIEYAYDVQDAERRVIHLKAGPTRDDMETLTFDQTSVSGGADSGSVTLSSALSSTSWFNASAFNPGLAETQTQTFYVEVEIEIRRSNGESVTESVTREATVTVHDGGTIEVQVGGDVTVTVETA